MFEILPHTHAHENTRAHTHARTHARTDTHIMAILLHPTGF